MNLLVITQKVNKQDPVLGFFHGWLLALARRYDQLIVICLEVGEYDLPANVIVYPLGKPPAGWSRSPLKRFFLKIGALWRFYVFIIGQRENYDAVFVHMNAEYVLWAGWFWRLARKKIGLWYNHTVGSGALKCAARWADVLMHTSPYAYTARYLQAVRMPAGIDIDLFKPLPAVVKDNN